VRQVHISSRLNGSYLYTHSYLKSHDLGGIHRICIKCGYENANSFVQKSEASWRCIIRNEWSGFSIWNCTKCQYQTDCIRWPYKKERMKSARCRKIWQWTPRKRSPTVPLVPPSFPEHSTFRLKCTFPLLDTWQRSRVSEPLARHSLYEPSRQAKHCRDCSPSLSLYKHCCPSPGRSRSTSP
jgi:hypothetical protein